MLRRMRIRDFIIACVAFGYGTQKGMLLKNFGEQYMEILVGTYTESPAGGADAGEGIYSVRFDCQTGEFGQPNLLAKCTNPSALVTSPDGKMLFAVREVLTNNEPALLVFRRSAGGVLSTRSTMNVTGELPCHLAYNPTHERLASAQYGTGDIAISSVRNGELRPPTYLTRSGCGPNPERQEGPHAHYVAFTDSGTVLHHVDLGTDTILSYRLNAGNDVEKTMALSVTAGSGPRHMAVSRDESKAWVLCELDESLVFVVRQGLGWAVDKVVQTFDAPVGEDGAAAAIRLSPSEKHLYISGRRQSQIAAFTTSGEHVGTSDCGGKTPRDFMITPDGNWVISANQASHSLTSLRRDRLSGALELTAHSCSISSPVALITV